MWHEACGNAYVAEQRFDEVPLLDPFSFESFYFSNTNLESVQVWGFLPRMADHYTLTDGQNPGLTELVLSFNELRDLEVSGFPPAAKGVLDITRLESGTTKFQFTSDAVNFSGECGTAWITSLYVVPDFNWDNTDRPQGPRLFSHINVWNTALHVIREYGYTLSIQGRPDHNGYLAKCRWEAKRPDGTDLSADNPIELLGLVQIHRYHGGESADPYWWQIDGENIIRELESQWSREHDPTYFSGSDIK